MKELTLKVSDETFEEIKKILTCTGSTEKLKINVTEVLFRESPAIEIIDMKGELL